ncbi:hypothetical protein FA13DRAFT_1790951 [Coprinellus micaceus]|uniref:Uncharacterized protein n=1 Tax=Coprinellus micaceus TaxID=71717 RepID=A0A4Y7TD64_COPMI|nr:hypothetical protein FA13DRAFT_1790951 [Coprinellus micaceus]
MPMLKRKPSQETPSSRGGKELKQATEPVVNAEASGAVGTSQVEAASPGKENVTMRSLRSGLKIITKSVGKLLKRKSSSKKGAQTVDARKPACKAESEVAGAAPKAQVLEGAKKAAEELQGWWDEYIAAKSAAGEEAEGLQAFAEAGAMTAKDSASLLTRDNSEEPVPAISIDAPESKVESSIGAASVSGAGCADSLQTCAKELKTYEYAKLASGGATEMEPSSPPSGTRPTQAYQSNSTVNPVAMSRLFVMEHCGGFNVVGNRKTSSK